MRASERRGSYAFNSRRIGERFTAALASRTSCITRGRGGWLDLPRGGLAPPILCQLPGALCLGSSASLSRYPRHVRFPPVSDRTADIREPPLRARTNKTQC